MKRFFALVLTLCMVLSIAQFPVSAQEFTIDTSMTISTYALPNITLSTQTAATDDEGYTVYEVSLPSNPTLSLSEYYANELSDYQKAMYRAFMDAFCAIEPNDLALKQKVTVVYDVTYSVAITTQEQLDTLVQNEFNGEWAKLDAQTVYNAIQFDHTELFWVQGVNYQLSLLDGDIGADYLTLVFGVDMYVDASSLFASDSALRTAANSMNSVVASIIANAPTTSEYDMLVYFNDWLKNNNTYNYTHLVNDNYPLAHGAYSAFTSNNDEPTGPVCQGYAYALKYLCDIMEMNNVVITGDLHQTGSAPGPHAWNAVELDGNWYAIDTTSNDSLGTDVYNFLVGSATPSHDSGYPTFSASHVNDNIHTYPTLATTAYCTHSYDNDCDAECNECGETRTVGDHVYDNACDTNCNNCGDTREVPDHVYDNDQDAECNECGFVREIITHIPGDVNGDGAVNNKDLGVLRRFLNDWDVTIDELASDVNDDGAVNNKDLGILRRYLNDWDVVLK